MQCIRRACLIYSTLVAMLCFCGSPTALAAAGYFVTPIDVDLVVLLAPPPPPDSPQAKEDMEAVLRAQLERTPKMIAQARADVEYNVFRFAHVLGKKFTADALPRTNALFTKMAADRRIVVNPAKAAWHHKRPFMINEDIKPVVAPPQSGSYPSGHATFAYMCAIILSQMVPEKKEELFARAEQFAYNRVIAGVHYPSDIEAGRISGTVIAAAMLRNREFLRQLASAKAEVRRVLGQSAGK